MRCPQCGAERPAEKEACPECGSFAPSTDPEHGAPAGIAWDDADTTDEEHASLYVDPGHVDGSSALAPSTTTVSGGSAIVPGDIGLSPDANALAPESPSSRPSRVWQIVAVACFLVAITLAGALIALVTRSPNTQSASSTTTSGPLASSTSVTTVTTSVSTSPPTSAPVTTTTQVPQTIPPVPTTGAPSTTAPGPGNPVRGSPTYTSVHETLTGACVSIPDFVDPVADANPAESFDAQLQIDHEYASGDGTVWLAIGYQPAYSQQQVAAMADDWGAGEDVTYRAGGATWFSRSGFVNGRIFYVSGKWYPDVNQVATFLYIFDRDAKPAMDNGDVVQTTYDSLGKC